jgi:phosphoribosyl 1,2-cyclic phosphate phosphodiesterase
MGLKATFLGTGTSQGVPVIGCECLVCQSSDPFDKRLRTSLMLETTDEQPYRLVFDTGTDFRQQMLANDVKSLDALVFTHEHNDHTAGLDDVRPFNFRQNMDMPLYATQPVQNALRSRFDYIFNGSNYPGIPRIQFHTIQAGKTFDVGPLQLMPIPVFHGKMPVLGFRIQDFTYITDAKYIPEESLELVKGTRVLVLNALHHKPHYSHLNLEEALRIVDLIKPRAAYFTHISHSMGLHRQVQQQLPDHVFLAYDNLAFEIFD